MQHIPLPKKGEILCILLPVKFHALKFFAANFYLYNDLPRNLVHSVTRNGDLGVME